MNFKKMITKSLDFQYFLIGALWFGGATLFLGIIAIALSIANISHPAFMTATLFLFIFLIPITLYYILRIILLYVNVNSCILYTATPKEVHNNPISLWRSCYFTFEIQKEDGSTLTAESSAVFKHSEWSSAYFGNYVNKPLQILYNPKNETLIVLGKDTKKQ